MACNKNAPTGRKTGTVKQIIQTLILGWLALVGALLPQTAAAAPFAAYVMDARTGKEIYSQNADARLHPASLTKMMTLYMAFTAIERGQVRLDSRFTVSSHAASQPPSRLGLRPGQQIELRYLIRAAAVKSANDAATVIGEGLAGSEPRFAQQMTAMAKALGMRNSNFRNANGLTTENHFSTARDLTLLGRRLFYDFPQYYSIFSRRSADAGVAKVSSTNRRFLDSYQGADGIKTGYTRAAGFNLTASAQRGSKRIIATVMGGTSTAQRNATMAQLLDAGFGKAPTKVREIRPDPPSYMVEKKRTVQVARVEPKAVAPVVLTAAARPAARASTMSAPVVPTRAEVQQHDASGPSRLAQSGRPRRNPRRTVAAVSSATDQAVAAALAAPVKPAAKPEEMAAALPAAAASTAVVDGSNRPAAAPSRRSRKNADAADAVAAASTFAVAQVEYPATTEPELAEGDRPDDSVALLSSAAPLKRTDTIILAAMDTDDEEPAATQMIARRDGGRGGYGISLGLYHSRKEAEQLLLRTALQESATLNDAHRSVSDTVRGFEPVFSGLSESAAELACGKIAARAQQCTVSSR